MGRYPPGRGLESVKAAPVRLPSARTLAAIAQSGADCRPWYDWAKTEIEAAAPLLGCTPTRVADMLALFSPRVSVKRSVIWAVHYLRTGEFVEDVTRSHVAAVQHYERTREIRGAKTAPFAKALLGDKSAIVLDTWMAVAFGVDPSWIRDRPRLRRRMGAALTRVAELLGWPIAETQAAIWGATVRGQGPYAKVRTIGILAELNRDPLDSLPV